MDRLDIRPELVARLVGGQFSELAHLPVRQVDLNGWDNSTFRLGTELLVRLPSAESGQATAVWDAALATAWDRRPVWVHGDVTASNLLVTDGRLSAVIDFGNSAVGDPACDLVMAWTFFWDEAREVFWRRVSMDDATWARRPRLGTVEGPDHHRRSTATAVGLRHLTSLRMAKRCSARGRRGSRRPLGELPHLETPVRHQMRYFASRGWRGCGGRRRPWPSLLREQTDSNSRRRDPKRRLPAQL